LRPHVSILEKRSQHSRKFTAMPEEEKQELQQQAAGGTEQTEKTKDQESAPPDVAEAEAPDNKEVATDAGKADDNPESEIDESNAEDAEDTENERRHHIPFLDYHTLSMENLVGELQRLLRTEKIQAIRKHVEGIKHEFDLKFQDFLEHKKEEFVSRGGAPTDFRYNSVTKRQFNELYAEYREKRKQYYNNLEQNLKTNLENRLAIIEELKGLVNMEEDMNTTYKSFKELQEIFRVRMLFFGEKV